MVPGSSPGARTFTILVRIQEGGQAMEKIPNIQHKRLEDVSEKLESVLIDFVFEQNPNLALIGSKEQYLEYLKNVFPNSKVKEILYHGTSSSFYDFSSEKSRDGIYFTPNKELARRYGENVKAVVVNIENPKEVSFSSHKLYRSDSDEERRNETKHFADNIGFQNREKNPENDGVVGIDTDGTHTEISLWDENQIHVLGSSKDLQDFKVFIRDLKE